MKQIEVTDKMYSFLLDLSSRMNASDREIPSMYVITEKVERASPEGCGVESVIGEEGFEWNRDIFEDEKEMKNLRKFYEMEGSSGSSISDYSDSELKEYLIIKKDYRSVWTSMEREIVNKQKVTIFLTEEAINDHMSQNSHHYNDAESWRIGTWRNPEMKKLHEFLKGLTREK